MINKNTDIRYIKGIGEKRAELFNKLGVFCVGDLLRYLPRGYEDRTDMRDICDIEEGESVCIKGSLAGGIRSFRAKTGARVIQTRVSDGTGIINLTWFNAPYVEKVLKSDDFFSFFGKVTKRGIIPEMINPLIESEKVSGDKMGKIVPIYPCTAGLTQNNIRSAVQNALESSGDSIADIIPESIREKYGLIDAETAIKTIHSPQSFDDFESARKTLAFEEFLVLQTGVAAAKQTKTALSAPIISDVKCIADFADKLAFELTNAQKRVINEISADIKRDIPMNRLVQGDVGCGKTIVAAAVMYAVAKAGYTSALMAPTEVLARQHYESLTKGFEKAGLDINVELLVGSMTAKQKREAYARIADGTAGIIVGTHALIQEKVEYKELALVITDEQHRFGVNQRRDLSQKGKSPHILVMSATPIPRTLAIILYGEIGRAHV